MVESIVVLGFLYPGLGFGRLVLKLFSLALPSSPQSFAFHPASCVPSLWVSIELLDARIKTEIWTTLVMLSKVENIGTIEGRFESFVPGDVRLPRC